MTQAEYLASLFHQYYEELAPEFGYKTREESAKPWADVPEQNKRLMIAVAEELLNGDVALLHEIIKSRDHKIMIQSTVYITLSERRTMFPTP